MHDRYETGIPKKMVTTIVRIAIISRKDFILYRSLKPSSDSGQLSSGIVVSQGSMVTHKQFTAMIVKIVVRDQRKTKNAL